jgi:hypothetical protein
VVPHFRPGLNVATDGSVERGRCYGVRQSDIEQELRMSVLTKRRREGSDLVREIGRAADVLIWRSYI